MEFAGKQARSIKYQITIVKLPLAKDVDEFTFAGTPINEALVRDLASGEFLAHERNVVLVGGTGTGKTHLAICVPALPGRDPAHAGAGLGAGREHRLGGRPDPGRHCRRGLCDLEIRHDRPLPRARLGGRARRRHRELHRTGPDREPDGRRGRSRGQPGIRLPHPVGRIGTAGDIAATVAFLASEEASFITGPTIDVNGGFFTG